MKWIKIHSIKIQSNELKFISRWIKIHFVAVHDTASLAVKRN